jgi:hypothetical protein
MQSYESEPSKWFTLGNVSRRRKYLMGTLTSPVPKQLKKLGTVGGLRFVRYYSKVHMELVQLWNNLA